MGDVHQAKQFQLIADNNELPSHQKLKLVDEAAAESVFGCGGGWLEQHRPRLVAHAENERKQCDEQWERLCRDLPQLSPLDRKDRCQNFISSWKPTYGITDACVAQAMLQEFMARVDLQKSRDANQWRHMYEEYAELKKTLGSASISADAWKHQQDVLDDRYLTQRLQKIDEAINNKAFAEAKSLLAEVRGVCGETDSVKAKATALIDAAWSSCKEELNQYLKDNGYAFAWNCLEEFAKEYPGVSLDDMHKVRNAIIERWEGSLTPYSENPDKVLDELKQIKEAIQHSPVYPKWKDGIEIDFSYALCHKINRMIVRYNGNQDSSGTQMAQLKGVEDWVSYCYSTHQQWFREVISRYRNLCSEFNYENEVALNYHWERKPGVLGISNVDFKCCRVRIDRISVDMNGLCEGDETYFKKLQGWNNADPKLEIVLVSENKPIKYLLEPQANPAWKNWTGFDVAINKDIYLRKTDVFRVTVSDDDGESEADAPKVIFNVPLGLHDWTPYQRGCKVYIKHQIEE